MLNQTLNRTLKGTAIAAAVISMMSLGVANLAHAGTASPMVKCSGANQCKGHGSCKSAKNACKGKNGCKGQGWVETKDAQECKDKGGTVVE